MLQQISDVKNTIENMKNMFLKIIFRRFTFKTIPEMVTKFTECENGRYATFFVQDSSGSCPSEFFTFYCLSRWEFLHFILSNSRP